MGVLERDLRRAKSVVTIYLETLRKNAELLQKLRNEARANIDWCVSHHLKAPWFAREVLEACERQLTFITCREAEIKDVLEGRGPSQTALEAEPPEAPMIQ